MKARRHAKILELINSRPIDTQDELLGLLSENGFSVTQATVSRDIKELRLVKTLTSDGKYHYTAHTEHPKSEMSDKFLANAVCAALDTLHWSGVVGTRAGDDTIFMVMRDEQNAHELVSQLRRMMA